MAPSMSRGEREPTTERGESVMDTVLTAERIFTPEEVLQPGWVEVAGSTIKAIGSGPHPHREPDWHTTTLVPGLVDTHVHGGGGASFSTTSADEAALAAMAHQRAGSTSLIASLVSAPIPTLADQLACLADLCDDGILAGLHLEGPWLSPTHRGAHDVRHLARGTTAAVERLVDAARGHLRMATVAPEILGGFEVITALVQADVLVAVGHTAADTSTTREALEAGARIATHLFNGMPPLHHRFPGPVGVLLADQSVTVELVADGTHVAPETLALTARAAVGRVSLVSDAMSACGMADGRYVLGSTPVTVIDGVARVTSSGALAGSTRTLAHGIRTLYAAGVPLEQAVTAATATPARALGLWRRGRLVVGANADLVALDENLEVTRVMVGGSWR
jgi:N-acetylglucosamine-6-phosphate deacetylase